MKKFLLPICIALVMVSCRSTDNITYFHDATRDSLMTYQAQFSKGIQTNDLLSIYVESETPEATIQFNQETNKIAVVNGTVMNPNTGQGGVTGYLVSEDGTIIFPVLGKINVLGLTHDSLASLIENRLVAEGHIKDPVVTVKLLNFKVCILGDVAKPGPVVADGERLTIFEALSMVGDLTIFGQRQNVTVVREENGMRTVGNIDLSSKDVFNSPYYYLHQNDVIYVEPNMKKKRSANRDPIVLTTISSSISIVSTLVTAIYYTVLVRNYSKKN